MLGKAIISTLKRALQPLWNRCRAWKASKKLSFFWWIQIIPKQEPQTEQGFDNNANIPKTQPDLQQEEATNSPYSIMEPRDIHHTDNEVLQLTLLSNDDDEFYVGCILDPRVTGWSEWIIFPKTHLIGIKLCFFFHPMDAGGHPVNDPSFQRKSFGNSCTVCWGKLLEPRQRDL